MIAVGLLLVPHLISLVSDGKGERTDPIKRQATTTNTGSSATFVVNEAYHPKSGKSTRGTSTILLITATKTVLVSPGPGRSTCWNSFTSRRLKGLRRARKEAGSEGGSPRGAGLEGEGR